MQPFLSQHHVLYVRESVGARRRRGFSPELPGAIGSRQNSADSNSFFSMVALQSDQKLVVDCDKL